MEILKSTSVIIAIILSVCFLIFLVWIIVMIYVLKDIPNQKIDALGGFFNKLPIKKLFNLFSNNNVGSTDN